jgi:hypothetical protein
MNKQRTFVHDMKNVLGIIIGFSTVLLDEVPDGDAKRLDLLEIRKAGQDALALLEKWNGAGSGDEST